MASKREPTPGQQGTSAGIPPGADGGRLVFADEHATGEAVQNAVVDAMDRHGYSKASRFAVRLALAEAIANAFKHGHRSMPAGTPVTFEFSVTGDRVRVVVEDQGPGFDPGEIPDPTLDENIEKASGRGLMLIRAYMTSVAHGGRGNRLEMTYDKPRG